MSIKNISTTIPNPFDLALHRFNTPKSLTVMKVLGAVGVVFIGYQIARRIYSTAQNTFDQYVVDHASDAVILALSLDNTKLSPEELGKKAQLIQMRKDVFNALTIEFSKNHSLTPDQKLNLKACIDLFRPIFSGVDYFVLPQLATQASQNASLLGDVKNSFVKKQIVQSILLTLKPNSECSEEELARKQKLQEQRIKILGEAKTKTSNPKIQAFLDVLEGVASNDRAKIQEAADKYLKLVCPTPYLALRSLFPWDENGGALLKAMLAQIPQNSAQPLSEYSA